jgi:glycerol dehydrogenase
MPDDAELRLAAELSLKARHAANFDRALDTDTLAAALRRRA